jgi:hypothetical protein
MIGLIIIMILVGTSLPIAIFFDSKRRIGRPIWEWIILSFVFFLGGLFYSGLISEKRGPAHISNISTSIELASMLGALVGIWFGTFAFYRIATRKKTKDTQEKRK